MLLDIVRVGDLVLQLEVTEDFLFFILYFLPTNQTLKWLQVPDGGDGSLHLACGDFSGGQLQIEEGQS